jgi:anthranilate phosphoribosyltransferase
VGRPELLDLMANTLLRLGSGEAFVVHGSDGLDEVSLTGPTLVRWVRQGRLDHLSWAPEDFGLPRHSLEEIRVADAAESAARIKAVLSGRHGADRDFVLANAAAVLVLVRAADHLRDAVARAADAVDSGKALAVLEKLIQVTTERAVDQPQA